MHRVHVVDFACVFISCYGIRAPFCVFCLNLDVFWVCLCDLFKLPDSRVDVVAFACFSCPLLSLRVDTTIPGQYCFHVEI